MHEPLQIILGSVQFRGLTLCMRKGALIPRPETETVVGCAIRLWKERGALLPKAGLDLGTGSGCIALSLAQELDDLFMLATDISPEALALAQENARLNTLEHRIAFLLGDWVKPISQDRKLGIIVANPPYIRTSDIPRLAVEVRDYDPLVALDGGRDGCECYRRIVKSAVTALAPGGIVCLECGDGEVDAVMRLLTEAGCAEVGNARDLAGSIRTAWGATSS
jgi:release factor glutamine methyltransferase